METTDDLQHRLREDLRRLGVEHDVPGASVAFLAGGETLEATFGVVNARSGVAVTPDSLFMIQSITKVITATLVMQLVDEGLVELDDPVGRHLPGFRTADRAISEQITIRHLLTHTGGFEGDLWAATTSGSDALQHFVEDLVARAAQHIGPGEQFSYCNAGYGVLGRVVEVLRHVSYEQAVRRFLAEPLDIDELAFSADEALAFRTAIGHVRPEPSKGQRPLRNWAEMPPSNPAAGNQLAMSARGLLAVARMHLADGQAPGGAAILSVSSAHGMRKRLVEHPAALGGRSGQGLGWGIEGSELVGHGGGSTGVAAMLATAPRHGLAAVVLTNGEGGGALIADLLDAWFERLAGITPSPASPAPPAGARLPDPRPYVGRYESRQMQLEVAHDDARLWLTETPQHERLELAERIGVTADVERFELRPVSGNIFVAVNASGQSGQAVEFLGRDGHDRARFLFGGSRRAVPRVD